MVATLLELSRVSANGGSIANDTDGIGDVTGNATLSPTWPASILQNDTALIEQIDVSDICEVHGAAGALFWFTVMTTIVSIQTKTKY